MAMTATQMTSHVEELARKHSIRIVWTPMDIRYSSSNVPEREVYVPPITDGAVYAAVLHELGHVAHPRGMLRTLETADNIDVILREEHNAWAWAKYVAMEWTPLMEESYQYALGTYVKRQRKEKELQDVLDVIARALGVIPGVVVTKPGRKP